MLNGIGTTFLILFLVTLLLNGTLTLLNMRFIQRRAFDVPDVFRSYVEDEKYPKSISYTLDVERLGLLEEAVDSVLLIVLVFFGGFEAIDGFARGLFPQGYYGPALVFGAAVVLIKLILNLPFTLYDTFVIEERHGFNRTTLKTFIVDTLKGLLITALLGGAIYLAVLWFMRSAGSAWWLWAWIFLISFQIVMMIVFPVWIAPLFNKFTPLEEGELKERILELARQVRFRVEDIFIMDGSKRSAHSNAYFTGIGGKKRIVLFDTLVNQMDVRKIICVLAHEMGHFKLKHVMKMLVVNAAVTLAGFWILSRLTAYVPFYHGLGFSHPSNYAAIVIFGLCASLIGFFFQPIFSALSRRHEYRADRFAVEATGDAKGMAETIVVLIKENLAVLNPHPLYSFFHYSHPAPVERVKAILSLDT